MRSERSTRAFPSGASSCASSVLIRSSLTQKSRASSTLTAWTELPWLSNVRVALWRSRAYDRPPGGDEAEVAFVVQDEFQGRGLGTVLLEHLASIARRHGIRRFIADTLSDNHRMLSVFREAGFARKYSRASEVVRVVLDIAPSPEALEAAEERDRKSVVRSIERLLRPASVAVVGAARAQGTIGHQLLRNLLQGGFQGPVYPVNPTAASVASVPCWPNVESIPGPVDLALIAVPADKVAKVVNECGRKGVGALVVISAGFAETGIDGAQSQRDVTRLAHSYGMRIVGPNCFGVVNTEPSVSMNATFAPTSPLGGSLGFVSQSGGLGIALLHEVTSRGIGLSSFVSTGNKADISGNDMLTWWEQDPATKVLLLYLESFGNPREIQPDRQEGEQVETDNRRKEWAQRSWDPRCRLSHSRTGKFRRCSKRAVPTNRSYSRRYHRGAFRRRRGVGCRSVAEGSASRNPDECGRPRRTCCRRVCWSRSRGAPALSFYLCGAGRVSTSRGGGSEPDRHDRFGIG